MSNTPISGLPSADALDGTELLPVVQASTTKQVTVATLAAFGGAFDRVTVAVNGPDDTAENILKTYTIPGGLLGPNGFVEVIAHFTCVNNANAKTFRMRLGGIGGTVFAECNLASSVGASMRASFCNRNDVASQEASLTNGQTDAGTVFAWGKTTHTVNTASAFTVVLTVQKATGSDLCTLERSLLLVYPGA